MVAAAFVAHDDAASGRSKPTRNPVAGVCKHLAEIVRKLTLVATGAPSRWSRHARSSTNTKSERILGRDELQHVQQVRRNVARRGRNRRNAAKLLLFSFVAQRYFQPPKPGPSGRACGGESILSWTKGGSNLVMVFTGCTSFSQSSESCSRPVSKSPSWTHSCPSSI